MLTKLCQFSCEHLFLSFLYIILSVCWAALKIYNYLIISRPLLYWFFCNRWKFDGPTDSFKALVDMAAVHSSCRLCIHLATRIQGKDEQGPEFKKRPCKCTTGSKTTYHIYVRERGRFQMESIFLRYTLCNVGQPFLLNLSSMMNIRKFYCEQLVPI